MKLAKVLCQMWAKEAEKRVPDDQPLLSMKAKGPEHVGTKQQRSKSNADYSDVLVRIKFPCC